ncbi:ABC transporter ATP-binding protein [Candidatus Stoquefichus massiliensis]|uniref:ATP-binding cassette domain-containing protein n=1 Tax=Candidatus Stoquefichus massiliensis TaxID=1470350 RepID=UPI000489C4C7|nr:ABC transporter ATP-binding protein [Candidatus Stoquefichus massiliensis]
MSQIRLDKIKKSYAQQVILEDFSVEIRDGEMVTVIGGSGSGKTTMLKLMNGLLTPDIGHVYIDDTDIQTVDQNQLRRNIGYVIQNIGLFPHMTIAQNIAYVLELEKKDSSFIEKRVKELIQLMNLDEEILNRYPDELSGGQKQRIGIARALAASPKILLMDEAFGAVDEITRHVLQDEILRIHQQLPITIVFVTHNIQEALRLGERVMVMKDGQIEQFDKSEQIQKNPQTDFVKLLLSYR